MRPSNPAGSRASVEIPMRKLILLPILGTLALGGLYFLKRPQPIPVTLSTVETGLVESTLANTRAGSVEACLRTKLSTIAGGRIEYLGVKEGDQVKKGQLLLKLWNDDQQANAKLAQSQVNLAAKRVDEACIAASNAETEAQRQRELRAKGFVSVSREEAAKTEAAVKRASCNTAKADVAQAEYAGTVGNNSNHVAAAGIFEGEVFVLFDILTGFSYTRGIGNSQIMTGCNRHLAYYSNFAVIVHM